MRRRRHITAVGEERATWLDQNPCCCQRVYDGIDRLMSRYIMVFCAAPPPLKDHTMIIRDMFKLADRRLFSRIGYLDESLLVK